MVIEIRIESGTSGVTVSIKGPGGSDSASLGAVAKTVTVGGATPPVVAPAAAAPAPGGAPTAPIGPGGTGSGGSGVVVVGPIVIAGSGDTPASNDGTGGAPTAPIGPGGGGAPGSGVVVIGPIVIGGSGVINTATTQEIKSE